MSVVTEEMLHIAITEYWNAERKKEHGMRAALAAVAPLIAAQEREAAIAAAAKALDAYGKWDGEITPERLMKPIAAAIRSLGDAT